MIDSPEPLPAGGVFVPVDADHDALADAEARHLADGVDLERDGRAREHGRRQSFRDHVNRAVVLIFWTMAGCRVSGILVFAWHLLTPWFFLTEQQLDKLQTILVSALFSSALSAYANKRMSE